MEKDEQELFNDENIETSWEITSKLSEDIKQTILKDISRKWNMIYMDFIRFTNNSLYDIKDKNDQVILLQALIKDFRDGLKNIPDNKVPKNFSKHIISCNLKKIKDNINNLIDHA